jgi:hypothetical protein
MPSINLPRTIYQLTITVPLCTPQGAFFPVCEWTSLLAVPRQNSVVDEAVRHLAPDHSDPWQHGVKRTTSVTRLVVQI